MSGPSASNSISGFSPNCDELLALIVSSAGSPQEVFQRRLLPQLKAANTQLFLLSTSEGKDPLTILDPQKNTIGYLYFITTRVLVERPSNVLGLIQHLVNFINNFDPDEARLAADRFSAIPEALNRLASLVGKVDIAVYLRNYCFMFTLHTPILAIRPLSIAVQRFAPTSVHLTTLHAKFIKTCILYKHYKDALAVLDNDIEEVDAQKLSVTIEDVLLYHYYGGMVYIGMKQFERALEFFSLVRAISAPAQAASAIQIEAYKKYVLVSLLVHGKADPVLTIKPYLGIRSTQLYPLPKYTAAVVLRVFKNTHVAYLDLAHAFESVNVTRVKNEFAKATELLTKDKNLGLARQVLQALYRRNIQQLTQTYMTLSLADIAKQVGLEGPKAPSEAEDFLVQMIESGQIFASISHAHSQGGGMVSFHDNPDRHNTVLTLTELDARIERAAAVAERVAKLDRGIGLSKEFLNRSSHASAGSTPINNMNFGADDADYGFDDDGRYFG
ncbi:hypothetical protein BC937DRAFT_92975 [Endogone sp. FLAS-F59071]|nr:hypothetical protein BC937DRAFT_92975 [Endogone sp. FLAS-F59071]|eukprot:RUS15039.1 hypothetical protein BC937DRAFT_92975 [Endogone sp. FLAS-F59071]